MSTILVDSISDTAGTGAPSFPNGLAGNGSGLTSLTSANLTGALPAISGSSLTSLSSSSLTGALPAIDGSALTGVGGSTTAKAVGTYAFIFIDDTSVRMGDTYAGNNSTLPSFSDHLGTDNVETVTAGTWQAMGATRNTGPAATLMLRIA